MGLKRKLMQKIFLVENTTWKVKYSMLIMLKLGNYLNARIGWLDACGVLKEEASRV